MQVPQSITVTYLYYSDIIKVHNIASLDQGSRLKLFANLFRTQLPAWSQVKMLSACGSILRHAV